jgi:hypothetical protein
VDRNYDFFSCTWITIDIFSFYVGLHFFSLLHVDTWPHGLQLLTRIDIFRTLPCSLARKSHRDEEKESRMLQAGTLQSKKRKEPYIC